MIVGHFAFPSGSLRKCRLFLLAFPWWGLYGEGRGLEPNAGFGVLYGGLEKPLACPSHAFVLLTPSPTPRQMWASRSMFMETVNELAVPSKQGLADTRQLAGRCRLTHG